MGYIKKKYTNDIAWTKRRIMNYVCHKLGYSRYKLKYSQAIKIFAEDQKLTIIGSPKMWALGLYLEGRNQNLKKGASLIKKPPKKKNFKKLNYQSYLRSGKWERIRNKMFELRGRKCERCENKAELHIHHLHYQTIFNERPEDLMILCSNCHKKEHRIVKKKV